MLVISKEQVYHIGSSSSTKENINEKWKKKCSG